MNFEYPSVVAVPKAQLRLCTLALDPEASCSDHPLLMEIGHKLLYIALVDDKDQVVSIADLKQLKKSWN